ncbi:MAG: type I-B CRISPR-associated endonuclease Cas1b [Candidatus Wallbacteria bacterium]|nr:type I-B CRISPR-associated endonuclease Cas1b [Candidatus Wallbacteria bacterium]
MKRNYYLLKNSRIRRKDNTICIEYESGEKKNLPVADIEAFYLFGEMDLNTKLLNFLTQEKIPLHVFNYYGYYSGSYYPREHLNSGFLLVKQVEAYKDEKKRLSIACEFISGAAHNILCNLKYYQNRRSGLEHYIEDIEKFKKRLPEAACIMELMAFEGHIRDWYYQSFNEFLDLPEPFEQRVKRPPDNMINTLISFGNSLMYATVLSEIYNTQLNPTVSYLHEPGERRFSLSLDISEVFKPVIVDHVIFKLINTKMLSEKDFDKDANCCYLTENGKKTFIREYDERLSTTIKHRHLKRNVSYRRLIRMECYKVEKAILGEAEYRAFQAWW